jgi:hypothetical protein
MFGGDNRMFLSSLTYNQNTLLNDFQIQPVAQNGTANSLRMFNQRKLLAISAFVVFYFLFLKKWVMQKQQLQEDEAVKKILHLLFGEVYGLR